MENTVLLAQERQEVADVMLTQRIPWQHRITVFSGLSGSGKSTLVEELIKHDPGFRRMLSTTTRPERPGQPNGEYYHVSEQKFKGLRAQNAFLWTAEIYGNHYGTLESHVLAALEPNAAPTVMHLVLDCVPKLMRVAPGRVCPIFLSVPSDDLPARLLSRDGNGNPEDLQKRLGHQDWEEKARRSGLFHIVENRTGDLSGTTARVIEIMTAK